MIKPTYVTFEQAKLLKEKGFDVPIKSYYRITGTGVFEIIKPLNHNNDKVQETAGSMTYISAPEQWQVVEWLRVKHGILIFIEPANGKEDKCLFAWYICDDEQNILNSDSNYTANGDKHFKTPQEAYSAAFDYVLKNLI